MKGWYNSEEEVISDDCFGPWMVQDLAPISMGSELTYSDASSAALSLVSMFYQTKESCQFTKVSSDSRAWCLSNIE